MSGDRSLILTNQLGEPINVMISESPGWKLAGNLFAAAEIVVAAGGLVAAVNAAAEELGTLALTSAETWTVADALRAVNIARALKVVKKGGALVLAAVSAADDFLEAIANATKTIDANSTGVELMQETVWHEILTVDGFANLLGLETILLTVVTRNTRRAVHLKTSTKTAWTITETGAVSSQGATYPWDSFVTSQAQPAIAVDDAGRMTLYWIKPDNTLGVMDLQFSNWIDRPELSFGPVVDGVGVAYHKGTLYMGYATPFHGVPVAMTRQGSYRSIGHNGWDGEGGSLLNVPKRFAGSFIGEGGVSLASTAAWPNVPPQLFACFLQTDNSSIYLITHEENASSPRRFGHIANVYAPGGPPLRSVSRPSILYFGNALLIAVQQAGESPAITLYSIDDSIAAQCSGPTVYWPVKSFGPTLGLFKNDCYLAYSTPDQGIFIFKTSGSASIPLVQVTAEACASLVAFGANEEKIVLAWCTPNGAVVYSLSVDGINWYGPYPATNFVDPSAPDG